MKKQQTHANIRRGQRGDREETNDAQAAAARKENHINI